ncbi:hypothetical protein BCR34DRAFT_536993 [Clohesyomyces aquaticus]|uniref:Uncharacterized protein n=1 Tax=Clohesyomyces aquaticus TaxID=1231657 RepID=A0A1Y1ZQD9_9PLEO|nr:hypothetical protein BCR34DRAFT_536993 [Clohesyomyces aquaticus]
MRPAALLPLALTLLPPLVFATPTFRGFADWTCQRSDEKYVTVSAAQLQDLAVQQWATADHTPQASWFFNWKEKEICPSNSDDTYAWLDVPQWQEDSQHGGGGGKMAVVYYKETDTYALCIVLAAVVGGYAGQCK